MKNLLAVAQSIARQTATEGRSAEEYRDDFLGRLGALVEAQDLALTEQIEGGVKMLLDRILAPYAVAPGAVVVDPCVDADLGSRELVALGLVVHELATNAAKYGALSVRSGRVRVSCQVDEKGRAAGPSRRCVKSNPIALDSECG